MSIEAEIKTLISEDLLRGNGNFESKSRLTNH